MERERKAGEANIRDGMHILCLLTNNLRNRKELNDTANPCFVSVKFNIRPKLIMSKTLIDHVMQSFNFSDKKTEVQRSLSKASHS